MMVAEGSVDMCAEPELSLWDMAANAIIVQEAGGTFTGLDGTPGPAQRRTRRRPTACCTTSCSDTSIERYLSRDVPRPRRRAPLRQP